MSGGLYPGGGVFPGAPVASPPPAGNTLPSRQLDRIRADLESTLPGTVVVSSHGTVSDGHGGWSDTFTAVGTVPAVLHPTDASEERYAEQLQGRQGYVLTIGHEQPLEEGWRVTYDGGTFDVVGVWEWGPRRISRRATVVRVG